MALTSFELVAGQLIQRRDGAPPFIHSVRVNDALTMKYWDSLACAIAQARPRKLLLLGLGGGTVLQLLLRRGVAPACVAVERDVELIDDLRREGWMAYPSLEIVHEDARSFLARQAALDAFDAIAVDVYDERGHVSELYASPLLERLIAHLEPGGVLLMHCLDPMAKFPSLGILAPERPSSPSCSLARRLASAGMSVAVYPLWSSALIASARAPAPLVWGAHSRSGEAAWDWLVRFLAQRRMSLEELGRFLEPLADEDYSYGNLERLDRASLAGLAAAVPVVSRTILGEGLAAPETGSTQAPPRLREMRDGGSAQLSPATLETAMALKTLLEETSPGTSESAALVRRVCDSAASGTNPALRGVMSFALAWGGDFEAASAVLPEAVTG